MEYDVSLDFEYSAIIVSICDPDQITFGFFGIAEKTAGFATWLELGAMIAYDLCSAMCAKRLEVGQVGFAAKPELEWCCVGWKGAV